MYYRRKFLLALIEKSGGKLNKTRLQKLLLLATRGMDKKLYDFVPYQFGCYSFTANYDLGALEIKGLVTEEKLSNSALWNFSSKDSYYSTLKPDDKQRIVSVISQFEDYSNDELIKHTYLTYPFWAINSTIAQRLVSKSELVKINSQKRKIKSRELFTIGYEGKSLELYINKLIINDVRVLCDVRKNPLSMKFGFSKSRLKSACEGVGIQYVHVPQLGIVSEKRQELKTMADYNSLFSEYEKTVLKENVSALDSLSKLFKEKQRIALTCFEKESCMCHRGRVAKKLLSLDKTIKVTHL